MSILVEVLLLGRVVASTVDLMATGPGTAKLVIGRISVIAVESEVTLKETVKIVQRNSNEAGVIRGHPLHTVVEAGAAVTAEAVTVDPDHLPGENEVLKGKEEQEAPMIAGALSGTGVHHHHRKGGSIVFH